MCSLAFAATSFGDCISIPSSSAVEHASHSSETPTQPDGRGSFIPEMVEGQMQGSRVDWHIYAVPWVE